MIFVDELTPMRLYRKPFYIPINEKDKKHGSAIFLLSPDVDTSIDMMHKKYIINNRYFQSYYLERNIMFFINQDNALKEQSETVYAPGYISEGYEFNDNYLRAKVDNNDMIIFFNEADASYNNHLKRILYDERIRTGKQLLGIYKEIKLRDPSITKTYLNYDYYKQLNLFIDLSYYNNIFLKNNIHKLDRGVNLYFEFLTRFFEDSRIDEAGYTKKTIFIPTNVWDIEDINTWDHTKNLNPISVIYRLAKKNPTKLKEAWGKYDFLFLGENGYFKVDFNNFDKKDIVRFTTFIKKISDKNEIIQDPEDEKQGESPKAITANIVEKIEKSQNIKINNLTGDATTISKEDIEKKIATGIAASKTEEVEKKKEELVSKIKDAAEKSSSTDEAIDIMDSDENIKKVLEYLAAEEDDNVKINAARSARMAKLNDEFSKTRLKNTTVRDMLNMPPNEQPLPSTKLKIDSINEEWEDLKFTNFEKVYDLDRDIVKILYSFSEKSTPVAIRKIDVVDSTTSEDYIETYTVQCEDVNGKRFTLKFDIPKLKNNRFMRLRGNEKVINGQLFLLPVLKTDKDIVQIVSNYNKIFVRRYGTSTGKSNVIADRIIKTINKLPENNGLKISLGDNSKICSKYELPIDYIDMASEYTKIEGKHFIIYFNQDEIRNKYTIDESKGIPIAYDKNANKVMYYSDNDESTYSGVLRFMLETELGPDFINVYNTTNPSSRYTYSKASILNTDIPIIVILGYNVGLQTALKKANIKYELVESRSNLSKDKNYYDVIKFKDGYLQYEITYGSSLLMNGLKECDTRSYSLTEINSKPMWLDFLDLFGGRIKADGLDNFYDLMIDPITAEVCNKYKLPNDYIQILIYANELLADNKYNKHTDLSGNRYRTNEIIAGYTYKALANSYGEYKNQLKRNRKGSVMTIKQSAVIDGLLLDPTTSDLSILNPLLEAESANTVSFKGLSGMNADRAYGLDKRTYDSSMINVLALSTSFAGNVGIARQSTIDMNIEGERGYIKNTTNTDNMSITKTFSMTEALTPYGTTNDDPFRSAMTFIQTSKHGMRVKNSLPMLISNGADEALPYLTSNTFAFKAKQDGEVVEKNDNYMVIKYKDGSSDFVDLRELVKKNSDGGFFITVKLDSDLSVGKKVKANDIVAYDKASYSDIIGPKDNIAYNIGTLCKVAIMNTDEGFEDSAIISEWLSDAMTSEIVVKKDVTLPKNTNIYNMVIKGQPIQEGDSLLVFQNAFDQEDMNILLKNLSDDNDENAVTDLGRIQVKSKITGMVQDINIYRTVEKEELSDSLRKQVDKYEKDIKTMRKVMEKYNVEDAKAFDADYKLNSTGKLKNVVDGVLIEFYLKYEDKMSVGDKLVYYSANKGVVKDIFPVGKEPYSEFRKDEKIHSLLATSSIDGRMVTSVLKVAGINKVIIELERKCKEIMGNPVKYLDE